MAERGPLGRGSRMLANLRATEKMEAPTVTVKILGRGRRLLESAKESSSCSSKPKAQSALKGGTDSHFGRGFIALGRGVRPSGAMPSSQIAQPNPPAKLDTSSDPSPLVHGMQKLSLEAVGRKGTIGAPSGAMPSSQIAQPNSPAKLDTSSDPSPLVHGMQKLSLEAVGRKGTVGAPIVVATNVIHLQFDPEKGVHHYGVNFIPAIEYSAYRYAMLRQHFPGIPGLRCYDGSNSLFLPYAITGGGATYTCEHPYDKSKVKMIVKFRAKLTMGQSIQMMNILMNNVTMELRLARLGRQHFNYNLAEQIPQYKLEVWPGFITSIQEKEGGIMLTCDVVHRVLRSEVALDVLKEIYSIARERYQEEACKQLLGVTVLTRYNNAIYRIDDIEFNMNPLSEFLLKDGSTINFVEYYKRQYGLDIKDLKQPLFVSVPRVKSVDESLRNTVLVPELCHLTGITERMRTDFRVMKDIANCAKVTPQQRDYSLRRFLQQIKENENALAMLKEWGLRLPDEAVVADGRVLPALKIELGGNKYVSVSNGDWSRDLHSGKVLRAFDLNEWILVHSEKDKRRAQTFASMMQGSGPGLGIHIAPPLFVMLCNTRVEEYVKAIRSNTRPSTQAVVVIVHQARDDIYAAIKKVCLLEKPVISQVVNSNTLAKDEKMRPIVLSIALQINAKMGGALWAVEIPLKNLMICGIDVYHDPSKCSQSVGAFVASLDPKCTSYHSQVVFQRQGQEQMESLSVCLLAALTQYHQINESLPETIVIYRDGVSDAELKNVKAFEAVQLTKTARATWKNYAPNIIYIVVQKRISTRIYSSSNGALDNCPPGTVLDHTITKKGWDNFLLVSQHVSKGAASPNHYIVVQDDTNMEIDQIQRLTYAMCHMYYNWPGTLSIPAPCQYAHRVAYLVGKHLKAKPHHSLANKLYYL